MANKLQRFEMTEDYKTPIDTLNERAKSHADQIFLRQPVNRELCDFSWSTIYSMVKHLVGALQRLGLKKGDKVAILSKNCAEWLITDLALMAGGYISIPIYPTARANTVRYVLDHSESKAIFVGKLDNWLDQKECIPKNLIKLAMPYDVIDFDYSWQELLEMTEPAELYHPLMEDTLSIIYTSGSTGNPKGTVIDYRTYCWSANAIYKQLDTKEEDRLFSYLPLAHITERVFIEGCGFCTSSVIYFSESLDTFISDLQIAAPTLFISVPRLWTLFQKNIIDKIGNSKLKFLLKIPIVRKIIMKKIKAGLGLQNARILGSGSAPVSSSLLKWYQNIGLNISEGWGMTENCAYGLLNHPFDATKLGTVGKACPGCEIKIDTSGELLFKSPGLFKEYYKNEAATDAAFTKDGFFKTGDQATIDDEGHVSILGRINDSFKTAKGKFVLPVPIEMALVKNTNIELVCVIGSGLPRPIALVQLATNINEKNHYCIEESLKQTCKNINSDTESHATIGGIYIVKEAWSVENDALTPTLKIKRHILDKKFSSRVENINKLAVVWES